MFKSKSQQAYSYLYQVQTKINIHQSTLKYVSKAALKNYRAVSLILLTVTIVLLFTVSESLFTNIKFLSDQGLVLTWLYFALVVQDHYLNHIISKHGFSISARLKFITELIFEVALCLQVPITIIEWTLLLQDELQTETSQQILVEVLEHSVPIILLLGDLCCNNYRFLRSKLLFIFVYSLAYLVLNVSYSLEVEPIYDIITWTDPQSYIFIAVVLILIVAAHLLGRLIYLKIKKVEEEEQNKVLTQPKLSQRKSERHMKSDQGSVQS